MGSLLRRYWHPVAPLAELNHAQTMAIRLLGEDLVLYRGESGQHHLVSLYCAHRATNLSQASVEGDALRCPLHGWLYDEQGQCLEQPLEEYPFAPEVQLASYPVQAKAGLLWAYLGPDPAPLVPDWEPFSRQDGLVQIVSSFLDCNWLQCQESSLDPDSEWLQSTLDAGEAAPKGPPSDNEEMAFEEFEYGFIYRHAPKEHAPDEGWSVGGTSIWPNAVYEGNSRACHIEWYTPIDDRRTLAISWFFNRAAPNALIDGIEVTHWRSPPRDDDGEFVMSHRLNRKHVMWITQGMISDRTKEHLMESDRGIVMLRNKLFSQLALIADGGEPKGTLRSMAANRRLKLPSSDWGSSAGGAFIEIAGQPEQVARLFRKAVQS